MKKVLLAFALVAMIACGGGDDYHAELPSPYPEEIPEPDPKPDPNPSDPADITPGDDWTKTEVSEGLVLWSFSGKSLITGTNQIIDVADVDMNNPRYSFHVKFHSADSVSNIFKSTGAVVATNAGYGPVSVFIKDHGIVKSDIDLSMNAANSEYEYAWCNDGGVYGAADGTVTIEHTRIGRNLKEFSEYNLGRKDLNIVTSAPMLIDDYEAVGYKLDQHASTINKEYVELQEQVNPRTAIAKTKGNHLLFVVVNGRLTGKADGMTIAQLTKLLVETFNPQYALNMDGGGSSTLCVKGLGDPVTNVVNYPVSSNKRFDHTGQRLRRTTFYIMDSGK